MKKKLFLLLSIMLILVIVGVVITKQMSQNKGESKDNSDQTIQIVTSFYPMYVVALNIADKVPNMEVNNLTENSTGCLHDYQLTTEDMKILADADIFIMNGGGMESFMEEVVKEYPHLLVIDASEGVTMLKNMDHEEGHTIKGENITSALESEGEHDHGEFNPHVWLNPKLYVEQIENVEKCLISYINQEDINDNSIHKNDIDRADNSNKEIATKVENNAKTYIQKVLDLDQEIEDSINMNNREGVVIFHDAFAYLADRFGLKIVHTVEMDSDTVLSAGEIAEVIDEVKEGNVQLLFTEEQYSDSIAARIEAETDAKVYVIDSGVTGDGTKDSYINAMQSNLLVLKDALQ